MRKNQILKVGTLAAAVGLVVSAGAFAGPTDSHTANISVPEIREIEMTASSVELAMAPVAAGDQVVALTDVAAGTWSISSNSASTTQKLTADASGGAGIGLKLTINVAEPTAVEGGAPVLNAVLSDNQATGVDPIAVTVVDTIPAVIDNGLVISYSLSLSDPGAFAPPPAVTANPTVLFTLQDS